MLDFWDYLDRLVTESRIVIDRPRGSAHPRYPKLIYPLDYGYLDRTHAIDGGGVDVWLGSQAERILDAVALTVDLNKRDVEVKLLLGCNAAEKQVVLDFLNGASMRAEIVHRQAGLAWLESRRSVRRFLPQEVPRPLIEQILAAATWAPSAHNRQPWRFAVIAALQHKTRLAQALGEVFWHDLARDGLPEPEISAQVERSRQRIQQAPLVILLCLDRSVGDVYPDEKRQQAEYLMGVQSAALAGGYLLLAAHTVGLAGVWMCAPLFAPAAAQQALELPEAWEPQALILLGYPAQIPPTRPRQPIEEITRFWY